MGKCLPGTGSLLASQNFEFYLPVRINYALIVYAEIVSKHSNQRLFILKIEVKNQNGDFVLSGEVKVKLIELTVKNAAFMKPGKKVTLVTGASKGIGAAAVRFS